MGFTPLKNVCGWNKLCSKRGMRGVVGVIKIVGLVQTLLILQKHGKG